MSGRHTTPFSNLASNRTLMLRIGGGALAGAALAATLGAALSGGGSMPVASAAAVAGGPGAVPAQNTKQLTGPAQAAAKAGGASKAAAAPQAAASKAESKKVSANDVLSIARKQLGISENGSGGTKFQQWYMSTPRAKQTVARDGGSVSGYADAEWCDMFVSWVGTQAGISGTVGQDPYTVEHARWFWQQHRWGTTPKPGAVVFFSWDGGHKIDTIQHVGIVVKDNHNGTISTIEGNTGGKVASKVRDTSTVVGYGYPSYTG